MLEFSYTVYKLRSRIADAYFPVKALLHHDKNVLINRRTDDTPFFALVEFAEVGATAGKANAQGRLGNNHECQVVTLLDLLLGFEPRKYAAACSAGANRCSPFAFVVIAILDGRRLSLDVTGA